MGTEKDAEHGLGAGLSIGRQLRVRPLQRLRGVRPHDGVPAKTKAFVGKRRSQATGGIFCLREMEHSDLLFYGIDRDYIECRVQ